MKASIFMVAALAGAGTPALTESVIGAVLAHGGRLVAISPQLPDGSLSAAEKNAPTFDVLRDMTFCATSATRAHDSTASSMHCQKSCARCSAQTIRPYRRSTATRAGNSPLK